MHMHASLNGPAKFSVHDGRSKKLEKVLVRRRWLAVGATLFAALFFCAAPAQTIRLVSAPGKLYVMATNFVSTNLIKLGDSDAGVRAIGAILPGATKRSDVVRNLLDCFQINVYSRRTV